MSVRVTPTVQSGDACDYTHKNATTYRTEGLEYGISLVLFDAKHELVATYAPGCWASAEILPEPEPAETRSLTVTMERGECVEGALRRTIAALAEGAEIRIDGRPIDECVRRDIADAHRDDVDESAEPVALKPWKRSECARLRGALRRLAVTDEMAGMGDVSDSEGLARVRFARRALDPRPGSWAHEPHCKGWHSALGPCPAPDATAPPTAGLVVSVRPELEPGVGRRLLAEFLRDLAASTAEAREAIQP